MNFGRMIAQGITILTSIVLAGCCVPGPASTLPTTLHAQETHLWCWAASGQMVMNHLGTDVAQCTQANVKLNRTDCPCDQCGSSPTANPPCVETGWPDFGHYGFTFKRTSNTPVSWDTLTQELSPSSKCGSTPVAFTWRWTGGGGHIMVAIGYAMIDGERYVVVHDPGPACSGDSRVIIYSAFVSGATYTHWDDFYEIRD